MSNPCRNRRNVREAEGNRKDRASAAERVRSVAAPGCAGSHTEETKECDEALRFLRVTFLACRSGNVLPESIGRGDDGSPSCRSWAPWSNQAPPGCHTESQRHGGESGSHARHVCLEDARPPLTSVHVKPSIRHFIGRAPGMGVLRPPALERAVSAPEGCQARLEMQRGGQRERATMARAEIRQIGSVEFGKSAAPLPHR